MTNREKSTQRFELLIFDLDGTLIDTKDDIVYAVNEALTRLGAPRASADEITRYIGIGVVFLIREIFQSRGVADLDAALQLFREIFSENFHRQSKVYAGMVDCLTALADYRKVVLTNKSQVFTFPTLSHFRLNPYFVDWFSRESFAEAKPSPVPVREICGRYGADPKRTLVIGDTDNDLLSGQGAGAETCAVGWGYGNREMLKSLTPTYWAEDPADLLRIILTSLL